MCDGYVPGQWAEEGWTRLCTEALQQAAALRALAASSDLTLPEGSCTELPRGPSLCSARGSSVQDASGWETAGSKEASQPPPPVHGTHRVTAPQDSQGPAPEPSSKQSLVLCILQKAGPTPPPGPAEVLTGCFPTYLSTWAKMGAGRADRRVKLALTPQQL